jgi:hypothetical protein
LKNVETRHVCTGLLQCSSHKFNNIPSIFPAFSQHFPTIFPQIGLAKMVKKGVDGAALEALVEGGAAFFLLEMVEIYPEMNGNK